MIKGIYIRQGSPFYWLRYYDKLEPAQSKRRKSLNTKIEVTPGDWIRHRQGLKIQGNNQIREFVKGFRLGLNEQYIKQKTGIRILRELKLSDGLDEFKRVRSIPGKNDYLKPRTLESYQAAVDHFINATSDKPLTRYKDDDYNTLLTYFSLKDLSVNTISIYTRALSALWNYFLDKKYVISNIIEATEEEDKDPDPIPSDEMYKIINYFREDKDQKRFPHHYWIVYFMLLTGCRPSSAIVQSKDDIDIKGKIITIKNIKTGKRKKKNYYRFPLYNELEMLIAEILPAAENSDRLFNAYSITPDNYTRPLIFWKRAMVKLKDDKIISRRYKLKQIRPTFISFLINILRMDIYKVYKLADHADIKITDKHYINFRLSLVRKELDDISLEDFRDDLRTPA